MGRMGRMGWGRTHGQRGGGRGGCEPGTARAPVGGGGPSVSKGAGNLPLAVELAEGDSGA
jgi:hypothetical protein